MVLFAIRHNLIGETGVTSLLIIILDLDNFGLRLGLRIKSFYFRYDFIVKLEPGLSPVHVLAR